MTKTQNPAHLFRQALKAFPYPDLQPTGVKQGTIKPDRDNEIEYSEEFTFEAGQLLEEPLTGGGWIELRRDREDDEPNISAFFGAARNSDWQEGRVLPEDTAIQGAFDLEKQKWEFWIEPY
jgi:hypothetical protein